MARASAVAPSVLPTLLFGALVLLSPALTGALHSATRGADRRTLQTFCPVGGSAQLTISGDATSRVWNGVAVQGTSAGATWTLPSNSTTVSPGSQVSLFCLTLANVSLAAPSTSSLILPAQLVLSAPHVGQPVPLSLSLVTMSTDCTTVRQLQAFYGRMNMTFLAGAVEISSPAWLFIYWWQSPTVSMTNVNITCSPVAGGTTAAPQPPCLATAVSDAAALQAAVDRLQRQQGPAGQQPLPVIVVLLQDVTFSRGLVSPYWPTGQSITGNVTLAAVMAQNVVLDFNNLPTVFDLCPAPAHLTFSGFTVANMPVSYVGPSAQRPLSLLGMLQTSILSVRRQTPPRLFLQSITMVIAYDEFAFWSYWLSLGLSPTPAVATLASWSRFKAVQGGLTAIDHVRLVDSVALLSSWFNLTLANPVIHPLLSNSTGLLGVSNINGVQSYNPPTTYFQVKSLSDIAFAVNYTVGDQKSKQFGQYILVCANVSGSTPASMTTSSIFPALLYAAAVPAGTPPPAGAAGSVALAEASRLTAAMLPPAPPPPPLVPVAAFNFSLPAVLQVPTTVTTWPSGTVCWDLQQAAPLLALSTTAQLTLRLLSLMNLPPSASANTSGADPITGLCSGMWSFPTHLDSTSLASVVNLDAITMYVPPMELNLFLSAAGLPLLAGMRPPSAAGQATMKRYIGAQQVSSYGATWIYYTSLGTLRFQGTSVNLTSTVPPACSDYAAMPVYASYSAFYSSSSSGTTSLGTSASSAQKGLPVWAIAVIAAVVGGAVLAAALVAMLVVRSQRRRRFDKLAAAKGGMPTGAAARALGTGAHGTVTVSCDEDKSALFIDDFSFSGSDAGGFGPNMIDNDTCSNAAARVDPQVMIAQMALKNTGMRDEQLHILGVLGRGGHGIVYKAIWKNLPVAAKVMIVHEERHEQARHAMLEATISTSLSHPNIVTTYSYDLKRLTTTTNNPLCFSIPTPNASVAGTSEPSGSGSIHFTGATAWQLLIVQELCAGGTMRQMIDNHQLSGHSVSGGEPNLEHVLQLALDVALGLEHLHSKNVVHSDMTPNNVLLQAVVEPRVGGLLWTAKVADFGLSVAFEEGKSHMSRVFAGTPFYIAPETQNEGIISKASDIFAFGILLLEMVTGAVKKPTLTSAALAQQPTTLPPTPLHKNGSVTDSAIEVGSGRGSGSSGSGTGTPMHAAALLSGDTSPTVKVAASLSDAQEEAAEGEEEHARGSSTAAAAGAAAGGSGALPTPNRSLSSTNSAQRLLGGGGGSYGAARALPQLPASCPPQYCALVSDCLSPNPAKRPTINAVCKRLRAIAVENVPGLLSLMSGMSSGGGRTQSIVSGDSAACARLSAASLEAATRPVHSICEERSYV